MNSLAVKQHRVSPKSSSKCKEIFTHSLKGGDFFTCRVVDRNVKQRSSSSVNKKPLEKKSVVGGTRKSTCTLKHGVRLSPIRIFFVHYCFQRRCCRNRVALVCTKWPAIAQRALHTIFNIVCFGERGLLEENRRSKTEKQGEGWAAHDTNGIECW